MVDFKKLFLENKIIFIGRTYLNENGLWMNFSGSGISFNTDSTKIILKLSGTKVDDVNSRPYISILIDDIRKDYAIDSINKIIELDLDKKTHNITILKRSESSVSFVKIVDIMDCNFLLIKDKKRLKIEFYGDSLTCGFGTLSTNPNEKFQTVTESFLDSYAYLTAQSLNASYSAICVSGFPIYKSRWNEGFKIDSVADMFSIADYDEKMDFETINYWNNLNYIPDIVIINLGTNDCSYFDNESQWVKNLIEEYKSLENVYKSDKFLGELNNLKNKVKSFLDLIFKTYPNVKVIWALGLIEVSDYVFKAIDETLNEYNNVNLYNYHFDVMSKCNERGAVYHPSRRMHEIACKELVSYIKENILEK